ncbi:MAG: N-acetylglucosamine-6-phosphate deacetylase [Clostridia bacterium]|nr:N-acetylglucosamine-6-phosphate deacetylase [Clostridia bacterium]
MKGFINSKVYVEGQGVVTCNIGFEEGKIAYIGPDATGIEPICTLSDSQVIVPGFIDEHIHGAAGCDAMDGSVEALSAIANAIACEGTVGFLATTMTQSPENISKAMTAVKEYMSEKHPEGAEVIGIHLEGPFISVKHIGAQPLEYVAAPSVEVFKKYNELSGNAIRIVSMAPEVEGAGELVEYMASVGVVPSIGHTDATYKDIDAAIAKGAKNITHTFNAQKALHHREIGTVGTALLRDELNCELICDTIHVSVPAIRLVAKNKPHDKLTLVTDAMRAKHMPDGESELGGQLVIVKNGEARLVDGTLAGSVLRMNHAVKNVVTLCGIPFTDAIDFATINPATTLGVADRLGSIKVGKDASVTVLDEKTFDVALTIRAGEVIYSK